MSAELAGPSGTAPTRGMDGCEPSLVSNFPSSLCGLVRFLPKRTAVRVWRDHSDPPPVGEVNLFEQTLPRVADGPRYLPPVVITNAEYRFLVAEQALEVGVATSGILLEPAPRSTAPAIAAATLDVVISDHSIEADASYWQAIEAAATEAWDGWLATFGVVPRYAETGYGQIEAGPAIDNGVREVSRFVEKADLARAEEMVDSGPGIPAYSCSAQSLPRRVAFAVARNLRSRL